MTGHESNGKLGEDRLPEENVDVIRPASDTDTSHVDSCHAGVFPADSYHDRNSSNDASFIDTKLQRQSAKPQSTAECFSSISNCQIYDVGNFEGASSSNLASIDSVSFVYKKWDWLLFFVVIFAVISTYALIWAKGLGVLELTEGELKIYFAGWLSQMMGLVLYQLRRSSRKKSGVE